MQIDNDASFAELQNLLRAEADQVPYRDLDVGFLDDLHVRMISSGNGARKTPWFQKISLPQRSSWSWSWGGVVTATILLGVMLGLSVHDIKADRAVSESKTSAENLLYVKVDERLDLSGSIPAFVTKPQEF